jgi:radical SAM superfamily enzyme YgiQ (UPF0313 family)
MKVMKGLQIQSPTPPIGLAYIAATLKEHNIEYSVIDGCGEALEKITPFEGRPDIYIQGLAIDEIVDRIPRESDIIGITCIFSNCWPVVRELAKAIRSRFSDSLIVVGGEHATALPELVLKSSPIDVCVLGEGEETFLKVIEAYRNRNSRKKENGLLQMVDEPKSVNIFDNISGIACLVGDEYRNYELSSRTRNIDDFPWPDWESFPIEKYISARQVTGIHLGRAIPILGTRGCPYKCTFCSSPNMWTTIWIHREPSKLVDEMEYFRKKYDLKGFTFMDLTFVINKKTVKSFARELIQRNLDIVYQLPSGTRSEGFDEEVGNLLYESGLRNFAFAPESGSEEVRALIKKQIDIGKMFDAIRFCLKKPMTIACYVVIGFPEDTPNSLKETIRLVRKLAAVGIHDITVSKFVPYPGSAHFQTLLKKRKITLDDHYFLSPLDFYTDKSTSYCDAVSDRSLYWWMIWMFSNFYIISFCLHPWRVLRSFVIYFTKGVEETRYMRWFADRFVVRNNWRKKFRKGRVTPTKIREK